jgi:ethanolamine transporter EutH
MLYPPSMHLQEHQHPRTVEWLVLALVLAATVITTFAMLGSLSAGTSLAVLAVLVGGFVLAIGALFEPQED